MSAGAIAESQVLLEWVNCGRNMTSMHAELEHMSHVGGITLKCAHTQAVGKGCLHTVRNKQTVTHTFAPVLSV